MFKQRLRLTLIVLTLFVSLTLAAPPVVAQCEYCGGADPFNCHGFFNFDTCTCETSTPIIVDVSGHGFHLTDAPNGVLFDLNADG